MTQKNIVLHVGSPKTASTSLQFHLAEHEHLLSAAGVSFPHRFHRRNDVHPIHIALRDIRLGNTATASSTEIHDLVASELQNSPNGLLISNESLLGEPFDNRTGFFPDADRSAEQLGEIFNGLNVKVIAVIRDQASLLNSYYAQTLRRGSTQTFHEFCERYTATPMSWKEQYLLALGKITSPENIRVLHFDHVKADSHHLVSECVNALGIDGLAESFPSISSKRNSTLSPSRFELIRKINSISEHFSGLKNHQHIRRSLVEKAGRLPFGSKEMAAPSSLRDISQHYACENALLKQNLPASLASIIEQGKPTVGG